MEGICGQFYVTPLYLQEIYHKYEEKGLQLLRLKEKNAAEYNIISSFVSSVLKLWKKSEVMSSNGKENALIISTDEVRCSCFCIFRKIRFFNFTDG